MTKERLSKILARAGVASRRACEELILKGDVKVNGEVVSKVYFLVDPKNDKIYVNNQLVTMTAPLHYYLLNKPKGFVCSAKKHNSTPIVMELFSGIQARLFTIGRLDKETQGLLLVTNDGHFAHQVIHPSFCLEKEYLVKLDREIFHEELVSISKGTLVEGTFVKPLKLTKVRKGTLKIVIGEGKKREVRVLMKAVGLNVRELIRIRLGGLQLGGLGEGQWRSLTERDRALIFEGK